MKHLLILMVLVITLSGCTKAPEENTVDSNSICDSTTCNISSSSTNSTIEKIEVYHFHGTNQCYSCKTVGAYAEETVNTYFADEVKSGKIVFGHINGELAENRELVVKYSATGSSLWIGTYTKDGQFTAEQNTNVWYKINDKQEYMDYLKSVIEQKLKGE